MIVRKMVDESVDRAIRSRKGEMKPLEVKLVERTECPISAHRELRTVVHRL